jgi:hypothetical protein
MVEAPATRIRHQLAALRDALGLLAAPASQQLAHLAAIGLPEGIDELALEFDDVAPAVNRLAEMSVIPSTAAAVIQRLDTRLDAISGAPHASLWTPTALQSATEWEEIRRLANQALIELSPSSVRKAPKIA